MQIESLKVFCDLVDTGSFSEAARRNSITQSAVSQQIRASEKKFGVVFFERGKRNFAVTPEGKVFHETAVGILDLYAGLEERLSGAAAAVTGDFRVGVVLGLGLYELSKLLADFRENHPDSNFDLSYLSSDEIYRRVCDGGLDVGLVPHPSKGAGIICEEFAQQRLVLACRDSHPLAASSEPLDPALLDGEPMVTLEPDRVSWRYVERALRAAGAVPKVVGHFDNIDTVKRAIMVTGAVAIVPYKTVTPSDFGGQIVGRELAGEGWVRPLGLLRRRGGQPTNAVRELVSALGDHGSKVA